MDKHEQRLRFTALYSIGIELAEGIYWSSGAVRIAEEYGHCHDRTLESPKKLLARPRVKKAM